MTSPVSGWLAWPVIAILIMVLAGRLWLLNRRPIDQLINHALGFALLALLLRERIIEDAIAAIPGPFTTVAVQHQVSFGAIIMLVQALYGIAKLWDDAPEGAVWHRQRRYYTIGIGLSIVVLIAGTPARQAGLLIDQYLGWPAVIIWGAFYAPLLVVSILVTRIFVRELRRGDPTLREKTLYATNIAIAVPMGITSVVTPSITVFEVLSGTPTADPAMTVKAWTFFLGAAVAPLVTAVPLVAAILDELGGDKISRRVNRLTPLWYDLTDQFPEVRGDLPESGALRLHRMMVEVYDALLRLRQWAGPLDSADLRYGTRKKNADTAYAGVQIARALSAKRSGAPKHTHQHMRILTSHAPSQHLTEAGDNLLAVAKIWPDLQAHVAKTPLQQPETTW